MVAEHREPVSERMAAANVAENTGYTDDYRRDRMTSPMMTIMTPSPTITVCRSHINAADGGTHRGCCHRCALRFRTLWVWPRASRGELTFARRSQPAPTACRTGPSDWSAGSGAVTPAAACKIRALSKKGYFVVCAD